MAGATAEVAKRMEEMAPASGKPASALPLPAMQLATLLAHDPEHSEWAKRIADHFEKHGRSVGRRFVMPWLFQYQYDQKWLPVSGQKPASGLAHWLTSSSANANTHAEGGTPPFWVTDGRGESRTTPFLRQGLPPKTDQFS